MKLCLVKFGEIFVEDDDVVELRETRVRHVVWVCVGIQPVKIIE